MAGKPQVYRREREAFGQIIELLIGIGHLDLISKASSHRFSKGLGKVFSNHKNDLREPRADGIEDRVIKDRFSARSHWVHLF